MKASKSLGGDYDCQQNWPADIFLQCGEKGIVISRNKDTPSYRTAFFEAFPKEPSSFIRGEGSTLEDAELAAFKKYEKIMACGEHEYKRRDNSEHGICMKCKLFTSHCFPPIHSCATCNKPNVNYGFQDNHYCQEHYIEVVEPFVKNYSIENISVSDEDELFSEKAMNKYHVESLIFLQLSLKHNLVDLSKEDYKNKNKIEEQELNFSKFSHNKLASIYNQLKIEKPEENLSVSFFAFSHITSNLFLNEELYEHIFLDFYQLNSQNYDDVFKVFLIQMNKIINPNNEPIVKIPIKP